MIMRPVSWFLELKKEIYSLLTCVVSKVLISFCKMYLPPWIKVSIKLQRNQRIIDGVVFRGSHLSKEG